MGLGWDMKGLGHDGTRLRHEGTGSRWTWLGHEDMKELGHDGLGWDMKGLGYDGTGCGARWDWDSIGLGWDMKGLGHAGTVVGTRWDWGWNTMGLGHNVTGTHADRGQPSVPRPYGQGLRLDLHPQPSVLATRLYRFPKQKQCQLQRFAEYNSAIIYQHTIQTDPDKSIVFYVMVLMDFDITNDS